MDIDSLIDTIVESEFELWNYALLRHHTLRNVAANLDDTTWEAGCRRSIMLGHM
jgi:hypothetical protein